MTDHIERWPSFTSPLFDDRSASCLRASISHNLSSRPFPPPGAGASITQAAGRSGGQERACFARGASAASPHHYSPPIRHHPDPA
ncbi:uncharacterized [Tachysurus ichikawai]